MLTRFTAARGGRGWAHLFGRRLL